MSSVIDWDVQIFELVNGGFRSPFLDWLMPIWRNGFIWAPFYVFLGALLVINFREKGWLVILFGILVIVLSDQISSSVIKPYVQRLRPCNDPVLAGHVINIIPCGSGYSFPSSHAANHFAIAMFISFMFPGRRMRWVTPVMFAWALSVVYAQVYVGVHYPMDVLFGGLLGLFLGWFVGTIAKSYFRLDLTNVYLTVKEDKTNKPREEFKSRF